LTEMFTSDRKLSTLHSGVLIKSLINWQAIKQMVW